MKHFFSIFSSILVLLSAWVAAHGQDDTRTYATWQVKSYDVTATIPQAETDRDLAVKATLSLRNVSSSAASSLTLRISPKAVVGSVTINGSAADFSKREEPIGSGNTLQRISMRIAAVAPGGDVTATVEYKLNVKENTALGALSPVGSQFLPLSFWYPTPNSWYFPRGADHAPFRLQVNSARQTVLSSGDGKAAVFDQKLGGQPFFVTGDWDRIAAGNTEVYVPKGLGVSEQERAASLATLANDAKAFMSAKLGNAPSTPIRLIATNRGAGFSGGGTILVDAGLFRRSKLDSVTVMNIAEAMGRIWLGNAVGISGDGQGAIREGLVRFLATEFVESKYGKDVADAERARQRAIYAVVSKRDAPLSTVSPLDDFYYPEVANKGAMIWRIVVRKVGEKPFYDALQANMKDGSLDLHELRMAFADQKDLLDYLFDQVTDMNLLAGLPQQAGGETKIALRNTGSIDATVDVVATLSSGENLKAQSTIRAKSFGEVSFKTAGKVSRVEIDAEKLYPQLDYSDDVAPREFTDNDLLLAVKKAFDKQDFVEAERSARLVLRSLPRNDDVRILLARSLLAVGKITDAGREFQSVLDEKLPSSRSLAWANVGLADISQRSGQTAAAVKYAESAIAADADYGATLAARNIRSKTGDAAAPDESVKAFFAQFDRAAVSNRKADIDMLVVPGEASRFASGVAGQTEQWQTQVRNVDRVDANTVRVETLLNIKLLNRESESGTAVFRLSKVGGAWKLADVELLEVR